jgi:transcriptional regulator with XRE-family HTH domain
MPIKEGLGEWIDEQLAKDAKLRERVERRLAEYQLEQQLAALREARGLSQAQLARVAGVSQPEVARIESGRFPNMKIGTLLRMVTALGGELEIAIRPTALKKVVGIRRESRPAASGRR